MDKLVRAAALLAAIAMSVACTACANDASSAAASGSTQTSAAASPRSAPAPSTPRSAADDVPPPPREGQCRNTRMTYLGQNDWVDPTPVVDCSKTHTLETVAVIKPVEKLTLVEVKQLVP